MTPRWRIEQDLCQQARLSGWRGNTDMLAFASEMREDRHVATMGPQEGID